MRRNPELLILAGLLVAAIAAVLWYVADRRAKLHATPTTALVQSPAPGPTTSPAPANPAASPAASKSAGPIDPTTHDRPTSDSSSGQPVAKNPTEDKTAVAGASASSEPVDLTKHDQQTIDFSGGKPVVKNSAEDKAAIDAAMKDIQSAEKEVTFEASKKDASPKK